MRWLMYFTIGFAIACFCGVCLHITALWLFAAPLLLVLVLFCGRWERTALVAVILAGFVAGQLWYEAYGKLFLTPVRSMDGITQTAVIRTSDYSYETAYGMAVDGTFAVGGRNYQVRAYLDPGVPVLPGESLSGEFRFRLTLPDAKEGGTHHPEKGIFLLAYQKGELTRRQEEPRWQDIPAKLRLQIKTILQMYFPEDAVPFAKALLLGDTTDLSYGVDTDLKISGIRHVVAVSGLHVSILFSLVSILSLRSRGLMALLGYPTLFLFAALAGFSPSVVRSCIMCGLMLLALLTNREYDGPTALSFGILVMLIVNPMVITSVSLQLSAGSVAGIFLFQGRIQHWLNALFREKATRFPGRRMIRWFTGSVSVTLSAMSLTTPLCAWYFGMVSLVGPLTNLLALWVISSIFYGILSVCLLHFAAPVLAGMLASVVAWPIRYVLWLAKLMAALPLSAVYTVNIYVIFWLVFLYLLIAAGWLARRPAVLVCCACLGLCTAVLASWTQEKPVLTVLDVGQGQCLLFQSAGKTVMVDCGGDSAQEAADLAERTLLSQGNDYLDVMILTHLDADHAAGAQLLLSRMEVGLLVLPWEYGELDTGKAHEVVFAAQDLELTLQDAKVQIYAPGFAGNGNEMSLCVLFDTQMCDILVTGDRSGVGERLLLTQEFLPKVDVLIAGHHGSRNSTSEELLAAVQPETVCISAGRDNPYGHPAPELLERLNRYGCQIYRTDVHGTITIRR